MLNGTWPPGGNSLDPAEAAWATQRGSKPLVDSRRLRQRIAERLCGIRRKRDHAALGGHRLGIPDRVEMRAHMDIS